MICRKCGSVLEKGTKVCPFCEEMAESDADNLMPQTREEKDSRAIGDGMPPLVRLKELAAIPEEQDRLMDLTGQVSYLQNEYESRNNRDVDQDGWGAGYRDWETDRKSVV